MSFGVSKLNQKKLDHTLIEIDNRQDSKVRNQHMISKQLHDIWLNAVLKLIQ
jgi:hypothetical protein